LITNYFNFELIRPSLAEPVHAGITGKAAALAAL